MVLSKAAIQRSIQTCNLSFCSALTTELCVCVCFQLGTVDEDSLEDCYSQTLSSNKLLCQVLLKLTLQRRGCYRARVSYQDQLLSNGEFDIIVLSG